MDRLQVAPELKPFLALFVVYIVWGTTLGAIHIGVETIHPALLACVRFLTAGLLLLAFCLIRGEKWPAWADVKRHCIVGFLLFFLGHAVTYWAMQHITTGLAGTLTATNPFWMIWLASLMPPREKVHPMALAGVSIGFVGMIILLSPQLFLPVKLSPYFWPSVIAIILMAFFWCLGSIYARKVPVNTSLFMGVALQNVFAGALLLPVCYRFSAFTAVHASAASLQALAYLVFIGTILATSCYLYVLEKLPVPMVSTIAYVTPVITIAFGCLVLHEPMTWTIALGTAVILTGVFLVQWVNQKQASPLPASAAKTS